MFLHVFLKCLFVIYLSSLSFHLYYLLSPLPVKLVTPIFLISNQRELLSPSVELLTPPLAPPQALLTTFYFPGFHGYCKLAPHG